MMRDRKVITERIAAIVKWLLSRNWYQHHIASLFGLNQGRISEIKQGKRFGYVKPVSDDEGNDFLDNRG